MVNGNGEWTLWKFTMGDLIALGTAIIGPLVMLGIMRADVQHNHEALAAVSMKQEQLRQRVGQLETNTAANYVLRSEYRQDVADIKRLLERIEDRLTEHMQNTSDKE